MQRKRAISRLIPSAQSLCAHLHVAAVFLAKAKTPTLRCRYAGSLKNFRVVWIVRYSTTTKRLVNQYFDV